MTAATDTVTIDFIDVASVSPDAVALARIPRTLALRHDVLSIASDDNHLTIALPDAADSDVIERVRLITGMHVRAYSAPREAIRAKLSTVYAHAQAAHHDDEAPAIRAVDDIHERALRHGASDIHVEPTRSGGRVRQRVDGILSETRDLHSELYGQVVSRMKLLAGMDIADRRQPQDGRYAIDRNGRSVDARVSSMPTILGEKLVVRLLDHEMRVPSVDSLGMPARTLKDFLRAVHAPHGFVVVCGPTGSGKTTTLYAALRERDADSENLCSIEDPVEVRIPGVAQIQVNPRAGLTFGTALRSFLRQDPNVIMVGEMRDAETAAIAASASLSGQLVLTTLHSNDAPKAIDRLVELGVSNHTISAGLSAVIAQRLVRRLCEACREPFAVSAELARQFGVSSGMRAYKPAGCGACAGTGFSGRAAIFESLYVHDSLRRLIAQGASSVEIADAARSAGYESMLVHGVERVLAGETTFDELRRVLVVQQQ